MWNVIICDGDEPEREQLMGFVRQYFEEKKKEAQVTGCMDWPELEGMVKQSLPDVVIVAQNSVDGLNTITSARLLSRKIIWFPIWISVFRHIGCAFPIFPQSRLPIRRWNRL